MDPDSHKGGDGFGGLGGFVDFEKIIEMCYSAALTKTESRAGGPQLW